MECCAAATANRRSVWLGLIPPLKEFISLSDVFGTLSAPASCRRLDYTARMMLLYAIGVVLLAAALAFALVCWVIDRVVALSAIRGN